VQVIVGIRPRRRPDLLSIARRARHRGSGSARAVEFSGFDEGAQKRTRLHMDEGDRADEAIRVGEQVAIIAVRGLLRRPSEIARISALAGQFDDASIALRVTRPQPD
jgi:hypothetical protein